MDSAQDNIEDDDEEEPQTEKEVKPIDVAESASQSHFDKDNEDKKEE